MIAIEQMRWGRKPNPSLNIRQLYRRASHLFCVPSSVGEEPPSEGAADARLPIYPRCTHIYHTNILFILYIDIYLYLFHPLS